MGINCQIIRDNNGEVLLVEAPNGNPSLLYNSLLSTVNSKQTALNLWSYSYTDEFNAVEGYIQRDSNGEHLQNTVLKHVDNVINLEANEFLSKKDVSDIQSLKINSVEELVDASNKLDSLYSKAEKALLQAPAIKKLKELSKKVKSMLINFADTKDINTLLASRNYSQYARQEKSELGATQYYTNIEVEQMLKPLVGVKDRVKFDEIAQSIDILEGTTDELFDTYSKLQLIDNYEEIDGQLVQTFDNDTVTDLINTLSPRVSNVAITANTNFLNNISEAVWYESTKEIKEVLKLITDKSIDIGIDNTQLVADYDTKTRNEMLDYLNNLSTFTSSLFLNTQTDQEVNDFAQVYDAYNKIEKTPKTDIIGETTDSFIKLNTNKSEKEIFEELSYIKVQDNIYQKVDRTEDYLESLYQLAVEDKIIPDYAFYPTAFTASNEFKSDRVVKLENKEYIKQDIQRFLETKATENTVAEIIAYKAAFGHLINESVTAALDTSLEQQQEALDKYKDNITYLTGQFFADLKKEMLKERVKDSVIYNKVFKNIEITNKGIALKKGANKQELTYFTPTAGVYNHLRQYTSISKDAELNKIFQEKVKSDEVLVTTKFLKNLYANTPKILPRFKGDYKVNTDDLVVVDNLTDNFIRMDKNIILERVANKNGKSYYKTIEAENTNNLFFLKQNIDNAKQYEVKDNSITKQKNTFIQQTNLASAKEMSSLEDELDNCS